LLLKALAWLMGASIAAVVGVACLVALVMSIAYPNLPEAIGARAVLHFCTCLRERFRKSKLSLIYRTERIRQAIPKSDFLGWGNPAF
jgi:hypothetical protein